MPRALSRNAKTLLARCLSGEEIESTSGLFSARGELESAGLLEAGGFRVADVGFGREQRQDGRRYEGAHSDHQGRITYFQPSPLRRGKPVLPSCSSRGK